MTDDPKPRLATGVKLRTGAARGAMLLGPERILELDDIAQSIVAQFDGTKRVSEIATALAKEYDALVASTDETLTGVNDADYQPPFTFTGKLEKLTIKVDRPQLTPADIEKLQAAQRNNKASE